MPRLIERIRNVFDDQLTRPDSVTSAMLPTPDLSERNNELTAALLALKHDSELRLNTVFARLHELSFDLHLTPDPHEFRVSVAAIVDAVEHEQIAASGEHARAELSRTTERTGEHEQLALPVRFSL